MNKKLVTKLLMLARKADRLQAEADSACGSVVVELLNHYKRGGFEDSQDEDWYLESVSVFVQAGDGLMINDSDGNNIPVADILGIISKKGFFTYADLMESRV